MAEPQRGEAADVTIEPLATRIERWRRILAGYADKGPLAVGDVVNEADKWLDDYVTVDELGRLLVRAKEAEAERDEARKWANTMEHERDWETQVVHSELLMERDDARTRLLAAEQALRDIAEQKGDRLATRVARDYFRTAPAVGDVQEQEAAGG